MSKRKTNPRRIPATQADVEAARVDGIEKGLRLFLFTLIEQDGADAEEIRNLMKKIEYTADSISKGYIKWPDIERTLREEYDCEVILK